MRYKRKIHRWKSFILDPGKLPTTLYKDLQELAQVGQCETSLVREY